MKNTRPLIMLGLSLVAGLLAVLLAANWLTRQPTTPSGQIVVALSDIGIGQVITTRHLELLPWAAQTLPKGAHTDPKALEGRVAVVEMGRGEPVLDSKLAPVGTKGGLSAVIPDGKRAISVRVNEVVGVAGFTLPGNFVDIMVNMDDGAGKQISKIVLERILVLAVAQQANRDETAPKIVNAVTLEVTPEQAEKLDLARSVGNLSLVLRNQMDDNTTATSGIRKEALLGKPVVEHAPVAAPAPAPERPARASRGSRQQDAARAEPAASRAAARNAERSTASQPIELIRGIQRSESQPQ